MINSYVNILIRWDSLIVEMLLLAAIICSAMYLEEWTYRRSEKRRGRFEVILMIAKHEAYQHLDNVKQDAQLTWLILVMK